jgi:hypothetical protein
MACASRVAAPPGEAVRAGLDTPRIAADVAPGRPVRPETALRPARHHWLAGEVRHALRGRVAAPVAGLAGALLRRDAVVDPLARGIALAGALDGARLARRRLRARGRDRRDRFAPGERASGEEVPRRAAASSGPAAR